MFTKTLITIGLIALATSAAAAPAPAAAAVVPEFVVQDPEGPAAPIAPVNTTTHKHDKRTPPIKLYMCNKTNWRGRCVERQYTPNVCYNLGTAWNDQMLSAGPELYGACSLYETNYCRGKKVTVYNPGTGNLAAHGMGGKVTSIRCYPWSP
ncbi:hypothetical protein IWZ00DRAFT_493777 [Phyllosticta capitalensis]